MQEMIATILNYDNTWMVVAVIAIPFTLMLISAINEWRNR